MLKRKKPMNCSTHLLFKSNLYSPLRKHFFATMLPSFEQSPMKIHCVDNPNTLKIARQCLVAGEVIALPTDTVYGLACDADSEHAIKKLYNIKGRDSYKPVAICVKDLNTFRRYGKADHISDELLNRLLPGPITIVIERSQYMSNPFLNPSTNKIGIRIPKFQFIQQLCDEQPLALTSANRSTERSSLNVQEFSSLWPRLGGVFDAGQLGLTEECRLASTVIDMAKPGKYRIVRAGVALVQTLEVMAEFGVSDLHC